MTINRRLDLLERAMRWHWGTPPRNGWCEQRDGESLEAFITRAKAQRARLVALSPSATYADLVEVSAALPWVRFSTIAAPSTPAGIAEWEEQTKEQQAALLAGRFSRQKQ